MVSGCGELGDNVGVENRTSARLFFEITRSDGQLVRLLPAGVGPGQRSALLAAVHFAPEAGLTRNNCTLSDVVARDADGREVARRAPPLCLGERWVIEAPG